MGDMYFFLTDLERNLHALIKKILEVQYGQDDRGWWHLGVLETVRVECVARRERDAGYDIVLTVTLISYTFAIIFPPPLVESVGRNKAASFLHGLFDDGFSSRVQTVH